MCLGLGWWWWWCVVWVVGGVWVWVGGWWGRGKKEGRERERDPETDRHMYPRSNQTALNTGKNQKSSSRKIPISSYSSGNETDAKTDEKCIRSRTSREQILK